MWTFELTPIEHRLLGRRRALNDGHPHTDEPGYVRQGLCGGCFGKVGAVAIVEEKAPDVHVGHTLADPEWDRFVEDKRGGTYQQSSMWAQVKSVAGWRPVRIGCPRDGAVVAGCQVLVRRVARFGAVGYVPYGPLVANGDGAALSAVLDAVQDLVRRSGCCTSSCSRPRMAPTWPTPCARGGSSRSSFLDPAPRMTVRVDLRRSPDAMLAAMRARSRTYIRQAQRRGVVVREGSEDELPAFCNLVTATGRRQGFSPYPRAYYEQLWRSFRGRVHMLVAEYEGDILSGTLLLAFGDTVSYKMGGWSGGHREVRPNALLHWTGMQWAKGQGHRYYDLEGINADIGEAILSGRNPADIYVSGVTPFNGVTHFKLGLGGEVTRFPGCYDYIRQPLLRAAWPSVAPRLERLTPIAHRLLGRRKAMSGTSND